ncbi:MAG: DNA polymerase Y family protein [Spirochaetota bacterium]
MLRTACVELPFFTLQLLLRAHPSWKGEPVALLPHDRPLAPVLQANRAARRSGITPGMRYATALAVLPELQAGVVPEADIRGGLEEIGELLLAFTPHVEPWNEYPGIFWVDCGGLGRLWGSHIEWARSLLYAIRQRGFYAKLAAGFSRFGTFAAVRSLGVTKGGSGHNTSIYISSVPHEEQQYAHTCRLERLPLPADVLHRLGKLGIHTVAEFLALNAGSIESRFGTEAVKLYRFALGRTELPVQSAPAAPSYTGERELPGLTDLEAIASHLEPVITELTARLRATGRRASSLAFTLFSEDGGHIRESLTPAEPTGDARFLQKLVVLRLYTVTCRSRMVRFSVELEASRELAGQALLFAEHSQSARRIHRACSVLQAELGNSALVRARLVDAHLPGERFTFEPFDGTEAQGGRVQREARPVETSAKTQSAEKNDGTSDGSLDPAAAVRRIFMEPAALHALPSGRRYGPFRIAGRWWKDEQGRSFFFVEHSNGTIMWVYRKGREYRLQGYVE